MCRLQHPVLSSKTRRTDGSDVRRSTPRARTSARCPFRVPFSLVSFIRRLRMKNLRPSGGRMNRQTPAKPSFGMEPTWGQVHCQDRGECRGQRRRGRFLLLAVVRRTAAGEWPGIHRRGRRVSARPLRSRSPFFPIGSATDPNKAEVSFILVLIIFRLPERRETFRFFAACRIAGFSARHPGTLPDDIPPAGRRPPGGEPSFPRPLFLPLPPLQHDDLGPGGRPRECLPHRRLVRIRNKHSDRDTDNR